MTRGVLFLLIWIGACFSIEAATPIPRKVLALYDSQWEASPDQAAIRWMCEMPLNHLGIDLIYHDIQEPLPDLAQREDIRGVLTCFPYSSFVEDPRAYLAWAVEVIDQGKKFVILNNPGFQKSANGDLTPRYLMETFYRKLGLIDNFDYHAFTFTYQIEAIDKELVEFEHFLPHPLPPFTTIQLTNPSAKSYLTVGKKEDPSSVSHLVVTTPTGGYVSPNYLSTYYSGNPESPEGRFWYLNPFRYFQIAFDLEGMPIPDTTTLAGRRVYYSQIDGDAFLSISQIENYASKHTYCGEVILKEVLEHYPHLPVTVSFIGADLNTNWAGNERSQELAKEICALPHVELASHTYSHPFDWKFFEDYTPNGEKEIAYLHLYPYGSWQSSYLSWFHALFSQKLGRMKGDEGKLKEGHVIPRAYANAPFYLPREMQGSLEEIEQFAPEGKRVKVYQWSGDCLPWDQPIEMTRTQKIRNINGGSSIKDATHPSYLTVGPIGRKVNGAQQIFASADNENIYTYLWSKRFFGFQYVVETFNNTNTPRRIKPINLYYHFYSGERLAALNALLRNLNYIEQEEIIPVWTSRFCAMADGFFSTQLYSLGENRWQIVNRDGCDTVRFEPPLPKQLGVDFLRSEGVLGMRRHEDALYVALDPAVKQPILVMTSDFKTKIPYLIESRWEIWDLKRSNETLSFKARGWGAFEMTWQIADSGIYQLRAITSQGTEYTTSAEPNAANQLSFSLEPPLNRTVDVIITKVAI